MLVSFNGKGCWKCPFFRHNPDSLNPYAKFLCMLDGMDDTGDGLMNIKIVDPNIKPHPGKAFEDCPFTQYCTFEMTAMENV